MFLDVHYTVLWFCPILATCMLMWGNTYKLYLDKIVKLVRIVSNSHHRSHTAPLFANQITFSPWLKGTTLSFELSMICQVLIQQDKCEGLQAFKYSIRTAGPFLWNSLPQKVKVSNNVKYFRTNFSRNLFKIMINFLSLSLICSISIIVYPFFLVFVSFSFHYSSDWITF